MRHYVDNRPLWYTVTVILALLPHAVHAQARPVRTDLELAAHDAWSVLSAPGRATQSDWQTAALLAGTFAVLLPLDEAIDAWLRARPGSALHVVLGAFGESSPLNLLGRTPVLLPLSAMLYLVGRAADSSSLQDAGLGCATANVTTTGSRVLVSTLIGRLRPENNRGAFVLEAFGGVGNWSMRSFPGGHAANAMACTSYFNQRFDLGVAEPLLYALATVLGLARVPDGAHWTSDTFAGMSYGYAVGKAVAARQHTRARRDEAEQSGQPRLYVGWKLTF